MIFPHSFVAVLAFTLGCLASSGVWAEETKPRLKFRKGPTCMCSDGMSEADIAKGQRSASAKQNNPQVSGGQSNAAQQPNDPSMRRLANEVER